MDLWGIDKMNKEHEKLLFIEKKDGTFSINSLKEISKENIKNGYYLEKIYKAPKNYISISSSKGTKRINDLFHGKENFAYSKPVELMNYLLELFVDKKDIKVLDFFAGSGTIGESVMLLNKKDNQNRKFYLIEQMDYANSLTFERLKLVKKLEKLDFEIQFIKIEN